MINLLSKTGLGKSGHVRFPTFGQLSHASVPKMHQQSSKIRKIPRFPRDPLWRPLWNLIQCMCVNEHLWFHLQPHLW